MFSLSTFPLHRIRGTESGPSPIWFGNASVGNEGFLHGGFPTAGGGTAAEGSTLLVQRGKENCGNACLQLKTLPVVFQGEMGAPGARGDKGEKVAISLFWPEPLRPGEGFLC